MNKKIGTINNIKQVLNKEQFHVKKKFGQNFLIDQNILQKIISVPTITKNTLVIEIGPGLGSLTELLLQVSGHVIGYEIDGDLIPILEKQFENEPFTLIHDDFLVRNIDEDIESLNMEYDRVVVVANLPYYITTPIIFKILEESKYVSELVLMMQLEVAKRFTSKPSTKDYNSLSVAIQYKTKASLEFKLPRTAFVPAPNVDSAVIRLEVLAKPITIPLNEKHFFTLVRASFGQRRKTLVNNLFGNYGDSKDVLGNLLEELDLNRSVRAENLSVADFIKLSDRLYQK